VEIEELLFHPFLPVRKFSSNHNLYTLKDRKQRRINRLDDEELQFPNVRQFLQEQFVPINECASTTPDDDYTQ